MPDQEEKVIAQTNQSPSTTNAFVAVFLVALAGGTGALSIVPMTDAYGLLGSFVAGLMTVLMVVAAGTIGLSLIRGDVFP